MREVGREGEREKERGGNTNKKGKEGRGGSNACTVCTRLLGNATPAPPSSVGDCDVTLGATRFLALRVNRTVRPSPSDRVDAGPWAPARPRTTWATARALSCCTAKAPGPTNKSYSSRSSQTPSFPGPRDASPPSLVRGWPRARPQALTTPQPALGPASFVRLTRSSGPRATAAGRSPPLISCPALALPLLLSSQMLALSSVFFLVHLSMVIVVLNHIALGPVLPLYKTLPRGSPNLNLSLAEPAANPSLSFAPSALPHAGSTPPPTFPRPVLS